MATLQSLLASAKPVLSARQLTTHRQQLLHRRLLSSTAFIPLVRHQERRQCGPCTQQCDCYRRNHSTVPVEKDKDCYNCGSCVHRASIVCGTCKPQRFDLDVGRLEANFKRLQRAVHPDLFTTKSAVERDASAATSATLNVAYRILKDPASRAHYLLQLQGIDALGESAGSAAVSPALLLQVMEAREVLEAPGVGQEEVAQLRERTAAAVEACVQDVGAAFKAGQLEQARAVIVAMQYYGRVLHEAEEWLDRHSQRQRVREAEVAGGGRGASSTQEDACATCHSAAEERGCKVKASAAS